MALESGRNLIECCYTLLFIPNPNTPNSWMHPIVQLLKCKSFKIKCYTVCSARPFYVKCQSTHVYNLITSWLKSWNFCLLRVSSSSLLTRWRASTDQFIIQNKFKKLFKTSIGKTNCFGCNVPTYVNTSIHKCCLYVLHAQMMFITLKPALLSLPISWKKEAIKDYFLYRTHMS